MMTREEEVITIPKVFRGGSGGGGGNDGGGDTGGGCDSGMMKC